MTIKQAMVLAAGLGTRMRPITDTIPKPLVKIDGKPMIDYVLDSLAGGRRRDAVVNVHHFADQMLAHLVLQEARDHHFRRARQG
jgi:MurNAc alpha-1-phosphate uridylyltransferase